MKNKKLGKRIIVWVASFLVVGLVMLVGFCGYMTFANITRLSTNEETTIEKSLAYFHSIDFDYDEFLRQYEMESLQIPSSLDGHIIPADYIVAGSRDADTIIMIHGLGGNRQTVFPIATLFLEQGYNVLAYDQRSAGENTAKYTTFGYLESDDAADCVRYLDGVLSDGRSIYIWGVSNGAATAGIATRHAIVEERAAGIILDCPISNTVDMMRLSMQEMDLGAPVDFLIFCGDLWNRVALGFSYGQASSELHISQSRLPILIIATEADEVTPYWMARNVYAAAQNATMVSVQNSAHATIYFDDPALYETAVFAFM